VNVNAVKDVAGAAKMMVVGFGGKCGDRVAKSRRVQQRRSPFRMGRSWRRRRSIRPDRMGDALQSEV
jgi:hypothetical protein